jgi:nitrogen fixation protein FixH
MQTLYSAISTFSSLVRNTHSHILAMNNTISSIEWHKQSGWVNKKLKIDNSPFFASILQEAGISLHCERLLAHKSINF